MSRISTRAARTRGRHRGHLIRLLGALIVGMLVLTACADDTTPDEAVDEEADEGAAAEEPEAEDDEAAEDEAEETTEDGSGEQAEGGEIAFDGTYKIGVFGPGRLPQGQDIEAGAELAAEEINETGQAEIELVWCDSETGAPDAAVQCVTEFLQQDQVDAVVGGFSTGEVLAVLDTIVRGQVPYLSVSAASPAVTEGVDSDGDRRFIFRQGPLNSIDNAIDMCGTYASAMEQAGFTKAGILFEEVEFARPLVSQLESCLPNPSEGTNGQFDASGVEVVAVESHAVDATDFSSQFSAFEAAGAEFVIEVNTRQEGATLVQQWGELKPPFALGGLNVSSQRGDFFQTTDGNAAFEMNGPASLVRAPVTEKTLSFYDKFQEAYGRPPIFNAATTYDAIYTLADAVSRAGTMEPDPVVDALEETERVGVVGTTRFTENHDPVYGDDGQRPNYFQWSPDGEQVMLYPDTISEAEYQRPDWLQ